MGCHHFSKYIPNFSIITCIFFGTSRNFSHHASQMGRQDDDWLTEVYISKELLQYIIFQILLKNSFSLLINLFFRTQKYQLRDRLWSFWKQRTHPGRIQNFPYFFVPFSLAADRETVVFSYICFSAKTQASNLFAAFQLCGDMKQKLLIENKQTKNYPVL